MANKRCREYEVYRGYETERPGSRCDDFSQVIDVKGTRLNLATDDLSKIKIHGTLRP